MSQWKTLETLVARAMGGIRSWDTDHDVLVVTSAKPGVWIDGKESGSELLGLARKGLVELASVEVKNLKTMTLSMVEEFLRKNRQKAKRDGVRWSALAFKRKAGSGRPTPKLLIIDMEDFDGA